MKKRLISVLLAAGVTAGMGATAGCQKEEQIGNYVIKSMQPNLVVLCIERNEQNEQIRKLHRADSYILADPMGPYEGYLSGGPYWDFACDKTDRISYAVEAFKDGTFPNKEDYDEMCDICFPEYKKQ